MQQPNLRQKSSRFAACIHAPLSVLGKCVSEIDPSHLVPSLVEHVHQPGALCWLDVHPFIREQLHRIYLKCDAGFQTSLND